MVQREKLSIVINQKELLRSSFLNKKVAYMYNSRYSSTRQATLHRSMDQPELDRSATSSLLRTASFDFPSLPSLAGVQ